MKIRQALRQPSHPESRWWRTTVTWGLSDPRLSGSGYLQNIMLIIMKITSKQGIFTCSQNLQHTTNSLLCLSWWNHKEAVILQDSFSQKPNSILRKWMWRENTCSCSFNSSVLPPLRWVSAFNPSRRGLWSFHVVWTIVIHCLICSFCQREVHSGTLWGEIINVWRVDTRVSCTETWLVIQASPRSNSIINKLVQLLGKY